MTGSTNKDRADKASRLSAAREGIGNAQIVLAVKSLDDICSNIVYTSRRRKYAMKVQQKIDRALESFVRRNYTEWSPDASEAERAKNNAKVAAMVKSARKAKALLAKNNPAAEKEALALMGGAGVDTGLFVYIMSTDDARAPLDRMRDDATELMERSAKQLHVADWIESIRGIGILGLALIVAEAGALDRYANPQKLWKRLGYAPFDGCAGSTWKRETWRPRTLTKDEWTANPFSGERYAAMYTLANWLVNHQWISAKKAESDEGRPNGRYGEVYAARRIRTAVMHPDWTPGHRRNDALRIAFKQFLVDLWEQWVDRAIDLGQVNDDVQAVVAEIAAAGHIADDAQLAPAGGGTNSPERRGQPADARKSRIRSAATAAAGQDALGAQIAHAGGGNGARR